MFVSRILRFLCQNFVILYREQIKNHSIYLTIFQGLTDVDTWQNITTS